MQLPTCMQYHPTYLISAQATSLQQQLTTAINWQSDQVTVYGRSHPIPRLHQWYGDPGCSYRWSQLEMQPQPWIEPLADLRAHLNDSLGWQFNSVLANLYRDGNDSMGWHSDNEPELGAAPTIASISLGAERDFHLRRRDGEGGTRSLLLEHGSLLVMSGSSQQDWQHALPKRKRVAEARINLTFRQVKT